MRPRPVRPFAAAGTARTRALFDFHDPLLRATGVRKTPSCIALCLSSLAKLHDLLAEFEAAFGANPNPQLLLSARTTGQLLH